MARVKTIPLFGGSQGSSQSTEGDYSRKKALADMLMNTEAKPVYSTGQGLLSAGSILMGGLLAKKAGDDEKAAEEGAWGEIMKAMTGQAGLGDAPSPFAASSTETSGQPRQSFATSSGSRSGGGSRALASNERRERLIGRLVEKGYSQHAAEGVADNIGSESGFNTKAVGDNGTAFGIAQWRGPRFQNLKKYAADQGKDWQDFDVQTDYLDHELRNGDDKGARIAYAKLQQAGDADTAHDAFLTHYERPSAANLQKRLRGGQNYAQAGGGMPAMPAPDFSGQRQMMQQGMALMRNPRTRSAGWQMYQQGMSEMRELQQSYRTKAFEFARDERKTAATAEEKQADREHQEMLLERRLIAEAEREGVKYDRERGDRRMTLSPGQRIVDADGKVIAEGPPKQDANIEVGPDGSISVKTGKLTEGQSKDIGFYDRGASAELELREREDALTDFMSKNLGNIPAVGNYMKSDAYRSAEIPAKNFLAAVLRKDSGGAITEEEMTQYGGMFLPQPGDKPEDLRLKRQARTTALKAIKKGLGPADALAEAYPDLFDGKSLEPKAKGGAKSTKAMPKGLPKEDQELWDIYTDKEKDLFIKKYGG